MSPSGRCRGLLGVVLSVVALSCWAETRAQQAPPQRILGAQQQQPPPQRILGAQQQPEREDEPFPWWLLIPNLNQPPGAAPAQPPGVRPQPAPGLEPPRPDLVVSRVIFDPGRIDRAWVTVTNQGQAPAFGNYLRIDLLSDRAPPTLSGQLRDAVAGFSGMLGRMSVGAGWSKYFNVPRLQTYTAMEPALQDPAVRRELGEALARLRQVAADPKYRALARRREFARLEQTLARLLRADEQQRGYELYQSMLALEEFLDEQPDGAAMAAYLQTEQLRRLVRSPDLPRSPEAERALALALAKLKQTSQDPAYRDQLQQEPYRALRRALAAQVGDADYRVSDEELQARLDAARQYLDGLGPAGEGWAQYLELAPLEQKLAARKEAGNEEPENGGAQNDQPQADGQEENGAQNDQPQADGQEENGAQNDQPQFSPRTEEYLADTLEKLASGATPQARAFLAREPLAQLRAALQSRLAVVPEYGDADEQLQRSLDGMLRYLDTLGRRGDGWKRFFAAGAALEAARTPPAQRSYQAQKQLAAALENLRTAAQDPKYREFLARDEFTRSTAALQRAHDEAASQLVVLPPVQFKPFPLADPATGDPIPADTTLQFPDGRKIKAGVYYEELNRLEKEFNSIGYSLRTMGDETVIARANPHTALLEAQLEAATAGAQPLPPGTKIGQGNAALPQARALDPALAAALEQEQKKVLEGAAAQAPGERTKLVEVRGLPAGGSTQFIVYAPDPDYGYQGQMRFTIDATRTVPESNEANNVRQELRLLPFLPLHVRKPREIHVVEPWRADFGRRTSFAAWLAAHLELHGTADYTRADAAASAGATIFKNDIELLGAHAGVFGPKQGDAAASAEVTVLGVTHEVFSRQGAELYQPVDEVSYSDSDGVTVPYVLGVVPMTMHIGYRVEAGIGYGVIGGPLQATGRLVPFADAWAYAETGPNFVIGGGGAGVDVKLVGYRGQADTGLTLALEGTSEPVFRQSFQYCHGGKLLDGSAYAHAWVYVPKFGIPPWKKKRWRHDFLNWDGVEIPDACVLGSAAQQSIPLYLD